MTAEQYLIEHLSEPSKRCFIPYGVIHYHLAGQSFKYMFVPERPEVAGNHFIHKKMRRVHLRDAAVMSDIKTEVAAFPGHLFV